MKKAQLIEYLINQGFRPETLVLLNDKNLFALAKEYGWENN